MRVASFVPWELPPGELGRPARLALERAWEAALLLGKLSSALTALEHSAEGDPHGILRGFCAEPRGPAWPLPPPHLPHLR